MVFIMLFGSCLLVVVGCVVVSYYFIVAILFCFGFWIGYYLV